METASFSSRSSKPVLVSSSGDRATLILKIEEARELRREWTRRQVLEHDRVDILAREVLGYEMRPHHLRIVRHQHGHKHYLILAWRGAGKSTCATVVHTIFLLLKNPNKRILIASKSMLNAMSIMTEVKARLLSPGFVEVFGEWRGDKWDDTEFTVRPRTRYTKESNVTAVGIESTVASKHYDVIIADDLVDEENSRTALQRDRVYAFFLKTLLPCLEPITPDSEPGELGVIGTRYSYQDLYGRLREEMFSDSTLTIPVLRGSDLDGWTSEWEERFPLAEMLKRRSLQRIFFDSQYMLDCRKMHGRVYDYDTFRVITPEKILASWPRYMGVDLAISQSIKAHLFAIVVIAHDRERDVVYAIDHFAGRRTFSEQRKLIVEYAKRHNVVKCAIEAVAYQEAMIQELRREEPDIGGRIVPVRPREDKITRAHRMTERFEDGRVYFALGLDALMGEIVQFPDADYDDSHDAFLMAVQATGTRVKKERKEIGLW